MKYSIFDDFIDELKGEVRLCVMPVPRLVIHNQITSINGFAFYPASTLNLEELRIVSYPADDLTKITGKRNGVIEAEGDDLEWLKSAATQLTPDDFDQHTLVAFTAPVNWEHFLSGNHAYHCDLLQEMSEKAERAMDLLRFDFCRLHLPDTLPGRAGTFAHGNPYSGALFYTLEDHESYIVGGQVVTHHLVAGLGLEISSPPSTVRIGSEEPGNVARRGLSMFSAAMESNSLTSKFVQCMSLLEFLAFPDDCRPMKKVKREIAAHVTDDPDEYKEILDDIYDLTGRKKNGVVTGIRTRIVHLGERFEEIVLEPDRDQIFGRLERYIGKTLQDLIQLSNQPWQAVENFRNSRKP